MSNFTPEILDSLRNSYSEKYDDDNSSFFNNASNGIKSSQSILSKSLTLESQRPSYNVALFFLISLVIMLINMRVICIVTDIPRQRLRPINYLVAHLSATCIGTSFILGLYIAERVKVVSVGGQGLCMILSYWRNIFFALYPFNIMAMIYERVQTFRESIRELIVNRTLCFIWVVVGVHNIPALFMSRYEWDAVNSMGHCKQEPLLGSVVATVGQLLLRFLLVHIIPVGYVCLALFKIRSRIKFLYIIKPIPTRRIHGTVKRLRFVYLYSILFIIFWLPTGFILLAYTLLGRTGRSSDNSTVQNYLLVLYILNYFYCICSPVLFVCMNNDILRKDWWFTCKCGKPPNNEISDTVTAEVKPKPCDV